MKAPSSLNWNPTHDLLSLLMRKKASSGSQSFLINNRVKLIFNLFSQSFIRSILPSARLIRVPYTPTVEKCVIYVI